MSEPRVLESSGVASRVRRYPATHLAIAIIWVGGWLFGLYALRIKPPILAEVIGAIVIAAAYVVYVRVVERRSVSELTSALAIALEAGVVLGAVFMIKRRLWLPIGLHAAWNFTQAGIFGATVSGPTQGGLLVSRITGPAWATGGSFGPEASLPAVIVSLSGVVLLVYIVRSGGIVRPIWLRSSPGSHGPSL